jgi:hypothetical protein
MIVQLMQAKAPSAPPPPEIPATPNRVDVGMEEENADKNKDKEANSCTKGDRKGEFPHCYSPNPPVLHPHINTRDDPPKLDALNFDQRRRP